MREIVSHSAGFLSFSSQRDKQIGHPHDKIKREYDTPNEPQDKSWPVWCGPDVKEISQSIYAYGDGDQEEEAMSGKTKGGESIQ
jgi:hypothetical protein